ncbi:co-chaperone HscB [Beggiatoa leptomitoformis]|uniref:Co-chaperone protein HscB homolog n=1 Tax=Beggiatoa leptomitoformis TaxID=288004 RepID=A0A2N9YE46_9GAMM|nr:co-chaperone HscB [Beggiatoa leptomitoformis]ALG68878.1 co-chaperone HscB [Beggiatoa leptomitoformis]AUI68752.1 co-chaperone HscB [Beggiatoa leptomitoformis]
MTSPNYFELFGLPVCFTIDSEVLAACYRDLQKMIHPDKFVDAPERERRLAMEKATLINEAFQTLKQPVNRARYLLELQGVSLNNDSDTFMDATFLMAQMELRETLAEIKNQINPLAALSQFLTTLNKQSQTLIDKLNQQFTQQDWQAARNSVRQLQFFNRLQEETLQLEETLL